MNTLVKKIAKNPLAQLIFAIFLCSCFYSKLPGEVIRLFLTISTCLKELLIFVLPFLLFSFIAAALSAIPREGMFFVLALMATVFVSNFINVLLSGSIGYFMLSGATPKETVSTVAPILPLFSLKLSPIVSTSTALTLGVITGFLNSFYRNRHCSIFIGFMRNCVMKFMKHFFVPLLPLFVSGFLLKLFAEGKMTGFLGENSKICLTMGVFLVLYLTLWLFVAAGFKRDRAIEILKNAFPAIVTAFSTMSSAAALPLSLEAAHKNTKDKVLSDVFMPLTLNFHMLGDTIIVPVLAMTVMLVFNHPLPSIDSYIAFGALFIVNKFAGGGVPSGTIMVTIPLLKDLFGFDDAMVAFTMAFYGVIDPIATAGNVAANNFFVVIFQKMRNLTKKIFK
ncbi:MAG: dicarboxylate/amino acid:cation symporter [Puniceicoccales bacterium]|jgi:Na+/H+-dicarboxylate symporter|nr:dicarboxylate/amino acid:cation symporter [Puniceicoccales bacterium]